MWESTPWLVGGGAEHSAEVARLLAHAGTGGAEGIVTPGDLKVQPLAVPGTKVRVAPGAVLIANRYPGGGQQTYVGRNAAQHEVDIRATGSGGGRTDLVVARVVDPQYEGQPPADPNLFDYMRTTVIEGVPAGTVSARDLNLNYPAVALARVSLPASTGTVQASHITDLRVMAQPRKERHLRTMNLLEGQEEYLTSTAADGEKWPNVTDWFVDVPEWAQRVRVYATWAQVRIAGQAQNAVGRIWVQLGTDGHAGKIVTQDASWDTPTGTGTVRETWVNADDRAVPAALRGLSVPVRLKGRVTTGAGTSRPWLTSLSAVAVDIEFYETRV